jgi:predicted neuraminidase
LRILDRGFVDRSSPWRDAHAATITRTPDGLVAAWFAGSKEGRPDVAIWFARREGGSWGEPVRLFEGRDGAGTPQPCWNPVLHQRRGGPLLLFFKVGPRPRRWWGMLARSEDGGRTWDRPRRLPDGIFGPVKNAPLELPSGALLCGSSSELFGWRCQIERTDDGGTSWRRVAVLNHPFTSLPGGFKANQATLVDHGGGRIRALCRTKQGFVAECWSEDGGETWSAMRATDLAHPNAAFDARRLACGRFLLVHHPTAQGRDRLVASLSEDGRHWRTMLELENEPGREFSYPSIHEDPDGLVHLVYSWKRRRIAHLVLDPNG